jgi:hypothetical protein
MDNPAEETPKPERVPARGILVFYINTGNLPASKAAQYVKRLADQFGELDYSIPIDRYWFPVKHGDTRVEFISFEKESEKTIQEFMYDAEKQLTEYTSNCE